MQTINMIIIYYSAKKQKKLHVLEDDIISILKNIDVSSAKDAFFTGRVPNDRQCACLDNKSLSY